MKLEDVTTQHDDELLACGSENNLEEASSLLAKHNIGVLPVRNAAGGLLGILSERDVVRAIAQHGVAALALSVEDLMTRDVVVCSPQDTVMDALKLMSEHNIRHLPLIEDGILKKVISQRDLMKATLKQVRLTMRFVDDYAKSNL
ncbi:MAG: CBS domain-containing protein [Gammaproteobacteria bacterium]|nr:CBS domain-containing protein [Gammaproteobacteria bacterium]